MIIVLCEHLSYALTNNMNITKFVWQDIYSLGIEEIDDQHKHFFELVNKIYDALLDGEKKDTNWVVIIGELCNYALYHFSTEETYVLKFQCEGIEHHIKLHDSFRQKTKEFMSRVSECTDFKDLALEVADYARDWLTNHILAIDKSYIECFHAHGK